MDVLCLVWFIANFGYNQHSKFVISYHVRLNWSDVVIYVYISFFFNLGDIKRIMLCISELHMSYLPKNYLRVNGNRKRLLSQENRRLDSLSDDDDLSFTTDYPQDVDPIKLSPLEEEIRNAVISEEFRTAVSVLYAFAVFLLASFTLAVVHDRLPDKKDYPPLPDVILENIPVMPWAFHLCELCASLLMFFWCLIIVFHKHRLVVLRRSCAISGTIFLLRCFTMYATSLSVPGKHLQCTPSVSASVTLFS